MQFLCFRTFLNQKSIRALEIALELYIYICIVYIYVVSIHCELGIWANDKHTDNTNKCISDKFFTKQKSDGKNLSIEYDLMV